MTIKLSFQKQQGVPNLGIVFFWRMQIETNAPITINDIFIPELFFDYFFVELGAVHYGNPEQNAKCQLPQQALKTIHTHRIDLVLEAPLILYGARLTLPFAEYFWENARPANTFMAQNWIDAQTDNLGGFASQLIGVIEKCGKGETAVSILTPTLQESDSFAQYSPRHKRRLYKSTFGISRKELDAINNLHLFLGQTCDFAAQSPRIIEYVNDEAYYDQPHLNHSFKKMTGLSPLAYFEANSMLQDNLMAASYNGQSGQDDKI